MKTILATLLLCALSFTFSGCATYSARPEKIRARFEQGKAATAAKRYAEALEDYKWCWSHGRNDVAMEEFRREELLNAFAVLARVYSPAIDVLRSLRADAASESRAALRSGTAMQSYLLSDQHQRDMQEARAVDTSRSANATRGESTPDRQALEEMGAIQPRPWSNDYERNLQASRRAGKDLAALDRTLASLGVNRDQL